MPALWQSLKFTIKQNKIDSEKNLNIVEDDAWPR